jgi:ParB family chromosome partitioning protein
MEEAQAYERLLSEHGMTQEQVAERVGRDRTTVTNALRLLKLPSPVRGMVERRELSMGQARALCGLDDGDSILRAARKAAARQMSVRQVEALVRKAKQPARALALPFFGFAAARDVAERLQRRLGTRVRLVDRGGKGHLEIDWSSLDELDRLLEVLLGRPS